MNEQGVSADAGIGLEGAVDLDDMGSGVESAVSPRVRRAFGLLERFAPAIGARWATELWCTPPVMESDLRMPPGVGPGQPLEATWRGHRIAGESWGDGQPVYLVLGWGGRRPHLGVFIKPLVDAGHRVIAFDLPSHNESGAGALAPGRTTIVECGEAVAAFVSTLWTGPRNSGAFDWRQSRCARSGPGCLGRALGVLGAHGRLRVVSGPVRPPSRLRPPHTRRSAPAS